ncbi:hypothetical protein SLS64_007819 [Diaporthe eres]|uniref:Uncharacterized protein n=1 Tax=Diaporthe eres TaxID=83184 RepID=A0ABR1P641_DIAER
MKCTFFDSNSMFKNPITSDIYRSAHRGPAEFLFGETHEDPDGSAVKRRIIKTIKSKAVYKKYEQPRAI